MSRQGGHGRAGAALALLALGWTLGCGSPQAEPSAPAAAADKTPAAPVANRAPEVQRVQLDPDPPQAGQRLRAEVQASDPDGDALGYTYRWQIDGERVGDGAVLQLPDEAKDARVELRVVVTDGQLESEPFITIRRVENQPPRFEGLILEPSAEISSEDELVASPRAVDPDGDPITFRYRWLVNGSRVAANGPTLSSRHFRRGDRISLVVIASDAEDESDPLQSPEIRVVNAPPRITSRPSGVDSSGIFRYQVAVEDPDGDRALRYRLVEAPPGMTLDWLAGTLVWNPGQEQAGKHPVVIEVDDQAGGTASQAFEVEVGFEPAPASAAE